VISHKSSIIFDVKTGYTALSIKMTTGGGPEIPKFGVLKKTILRNLWFSKGDNFKFTFFFSPRQVISDSPSIILDVKTNEKALSIKMTPGVGPNSRHLGVFKKAIL